MSEPASISQGIADRYAGAVLDLAREDGSEARIEADVDALDAALAESADLRALIASPIYSRAEQGQAIAALAGRMGLSATMTNVLRLMADRRRLFVLPQLIAQLRARLLAGRGEAEAEVTSAVALTPEQEARLAQALSGSEGRRIRLRTRVDPSLLGGMVVRLGSRMIDTSVRARLDRLTTTMKEAG